MTKPLLTFALICCFLFVAGSIAEASPKQKPKPPVVMSILAEPKTMYNLPAKPPAKGKPLVLTSAKQAEAYFKGKRLKQINKSVDWSKQKVLLFYWRGSGGDRLLTEVVEGQKGAPKVKFSYRRGLTRDFAAHLYVIAIRSGVAFEVEVK